MNNYINYYYNLYPEKIELKNNLFYFKVDDNKYYFIEYDRKLEELDILYKLNMEMIDRGDLIHEIILNRDNKVLTHINNIPYILLKIYIDENKLINIEDIMFINKKNEDIDIQKPLDRTNWATLWADKIDYFEHHISEVSRKFPILADSINYYIGLGENAISYINSTNNDLKPTEYDAITISHKRIRADDTLFELYNPISLVIDYKVRDLCEYIKESFFKDKDVWELIDKYFEYNTLPTYSIRLLYARLLYPTYYFDRYESIIAGSIKEEEIIKIISKVNKYEQFLNDFYEYVFVHYKIPPISWLNKKTTIS
jgi:spore coat protein YutH